MGATRRLLVEHGYDQISIESIAREAGVSRPTVYRRWPSKAHVVFEAAFGRPGEGNGFQTTGDFDADLHEFVRRVQEFWREPVVEAAALGILAERNRDPELRIRTQQLLDEQTLTEFRALVQGGVESGRVRPDVDVEMLYELLIGTAFYAVQVHQHADDTVTRLCALVQAGIDGESRP